MIYTNLLLPIDVEDTASAEKAIQAAKNLKNHVHRKIHYAYVLADVSTIISQAAQFAPLEHNAWQENLFDNAKSRLEKFATSHIIDFPNYDIAVRTGNIYKEILALEAEKNIDMIIMTAHQPDVRDYLLGPNAAKIVRHAHTNVFVVR